MNLYNLHADPQLLLYIEEAPEIVPDLFWDKYRYDKEELKKRERAISKYTEYSYYYARYVLKGPFQKGEAAISRDAKYSYLYAIGVLKGPFPEGEEAISKDLVYADWYAERYLKADFYYD